MLRFLDVGSGTTFHGLSTECNPCVVGTGFGSGRTGGKSPFVTRQTAIATANGTILLDRCFTESRWWLPHLNHPLLATDMHVTPEQPLNNERHKGFAQRQFTQVKPQGNDVISK